MTKTPEEEGADRRARERRVIGGGTGEGLAGPKDEDRSYGYGRGTPRQDVGGTRGTPTVGANEEPEPTDFEGGNFRGAYRPDRRREGKREP
ncbi:MAG TPA: hypothetical protein VM681_06005 [Candidatus Thermoplasmatota archaeon]|nr:hypothetical protein [Candidatus Thermoplasmatota archaeon]